MSFFIESFDSMKGAHDLRGKMRPGPFACAGVFEVPAQDRKAASAPASPVRVWNRKEEG